MPKLPTINVVRFYPGQKVSITRLAQELGVVSNYEQQSSVMLLGAPASYRLGNRFIPWVTEGPIAAAFGGDGESIDFEAGPFEDWRESSRLPQGAENPEQREADLAAYADRAYAELDDKAGIRALIRAHDEHTRKKTGIAAHLMTLTYIAVLFVMLLLGLTFAESKGGIGAIIDDLTDAVEEVAY